MLLNAIKWIVNKLKRKLLKLERALGVVTFTNPIKERRYLTYLHVSAKIGHQVAYGPLRGLQFSPLSWNDSSFNTGMLLGLYEKEILDFIQQNHTKFENFINLGAADGYYGVGVLVNSLFKHSYCFEISELGQKVIIENAKLNQVEHAISVYGIATADFYNQLPADACQNALILVDIEGAEFDILVAETFQHLKQSTLIIELHDWFYPNAKEKMQALEKAYMQTHNASTFTMQARDLSPFPELYDLPDTDRWLICAEGRGKMMHWLVLSPKI